MSEELTFEREIAAPLEMVFDTFTRIDGQEAFYGHDDPGWLVVSKCDLCVGGAWSIAFGESPDQLYHHNHLFRAIDRPNRIVVDTTETRLDGTTLEFETEWSFETREGKTLMRMMQRGLPTAELRAEHVAGLPHAFARFECAIAKPPLRGPKTSLTADEAKGERRVHNRSLHVDVARRLHCRA